MRKLNSKEYTSRPPANCRGARIAWDLFMAAEQRSSLETIPGSIDSQRRVEPKRRQIKSLYYVFMDYWVWVAQFDDGEYEEIDGQTVDLLVFTIVELRHPDPIIHEDVIEGFDLSAFRFHPALTIDTSRNCLQGRSLFGSHEQIPGNASTPAVSRGSRRVLLGIELAHDSDSRNAQLNEIIIKDDRVMSEREAAFLENVDV